MRVRSLFLNLVAGQVRQKLSSVLIEFWTCHENNPSKKCRSWWISEANLASKIFRELHATARRPGAAKVFTQLHNFAVEGLCDTAAFCRNKCCYIMLYFMPLISVQLLVSICSILPRCPFHQGFPTQSSPATVSNLSEGPLPGPVGSSGWLETLANFPLKQHMEKKTTRPKSTSKQTIHNTWLNDDDDDDDDNNDNDNDNEHNHCEAMVGQHGATMFVKQKVLVPHWKCTWQSSVSLFSHGYGWKPLKPLKTFKSDEVQCATTL